MYVLQVMEHVLKPPKTFPLTMCFATGTATGTAVYLDTDGAPVGWTRAIPAR